MAQASLHKFVVMTTRSARRFSYAMTDPIQYTGKVGFPSVTS